MSTRPEREPTPVPWTEWDTPRERWLMTDQASNAWPRSMMLEVIARILFPTVLVFSIYLLFAGHSTAGGGFTGGLVAGLAFVLRYVAGGSADVATAVRIWPPVVIGAGLTLAVGTALVPILFGQTVLASGSVTVTLPLMGELKLASNLLLDIGVYLLIIGVVVDLLRTAGAGTEVGGPGLDDEELEEERVRRL